MAKRKNLPAYDAKVTALRRNTDIRNEFNKLINKKERGVAVYNMDYVLDQVAYKFYLSPNYILTIVQERDWYSRNGIFNKQLNLFKDEK